MVHVNDILMGGDSEGWDRFKEVINTFRHGEYELLREKKEIIFLGIRLRLLPDQGISLDQELFIGQIQEIKVHEYISKDGKFVCKRQ